MFVLNLSTKFSLEYFSFSEELSEIWFTMYICFRFKCLLFLLKFKKFKFSRQILEKYSISDFMKILPVGAELFHADRQTERHK